MRLHDEHGTPWYVSAGDPANKLLAVLKRARLDFVVLPRYTYRTGHLPPYPTIVGEHEDGSDPFLRSIRLRDCLHLLTKET